MRFVIVLLAAVILPAPALAQCSYTDLVDDTPMAVSSSPTFGRFAQSAGRWAAVAVKSNPGANWDVGISTATAPFAQCVSLPVVASQQASGIDFVLGDFGFEGTGTRYAPLLRAGGAGGATVEWDSGIRLLDVGTAPATGANPPDLVDCWGVDLVAGTSYKIRLMGDAPDDYRLYAFGHGGANTWRQKSDALVEVTSNLSFSPVLTATANDRYALVVVNMTGTTAPYTLAVTACTDPPDLAAHVSLPIPLDAPSGEVAYQLDVATGGSPTVAVRTAQLGDNWDLTIARRVGAGFPPCDGLYQASSGDYGPRTDVLVGDLASGLIAGGTTHWVSAAQGGIHPAAGRIEYSPGLDALTIGGPTAYVVGGNDLVVRTFRAEMPAGVPVTIHLAKCGPATGKLRVFRPFDTGDPTNNGWAAPYGSHGPLATVDVTGVNDFEFTPPVGGSYALVLTNETAENCCFELAVSACSTRTELPDGVPRAVWAPTTGPAPGEAFAALHGRFGWSAIAVLPNSVVEDWVVEAWDGPSGGGGAPLFGCLDGLLGASTEGPAGSRVDVLARYDAWVPPLEEWVETVHARPALGTSPGGGAQVEFEMHNTTLAVGDFVNVFPLNPLDFMEVWNIELVGGQPYALHFQPVGFTGQVFVMRPPTTVCGGFECMPEYFPIGGANEVLRASAPTVFTPPSSGLYGLIVVHQIGGFGSFSLAVNATTVSVSPRPYETRFAGVAPNPVGGAGAAFSYSLAKDGVVSFDVVNIAGRVVARVPARAASAGEGRVTWSGRGDDNARVPAGVYFVRMRVDGAMAGGGGRVVVM